MKSAREIACSDDMGERGCFGGIHDSQCDARTDAIQAAREDGARWGMRKVILCLESTAIMNHEDYPVASDVRDEAP